MIDEVGGNTPLKDLRAFKSVSSNTKEQPWANVIVDSRKEIATSNVCEESDTCLGHSIHSVVGGDSNWSMGRDSNTSPHNDSVPERDLNGIHSGETIIHNILLSKEVSSYFWFDTFHFWFVNWHDVSSWTKWFFSVSFYDYYFWMSSFLPLLQLLMQWVNHILIKRIKCFGLVQFNLSHKFRSLLVEHLFCIWCVSSWCEVSV